MESYRVLFPPQPSPSQQASVLTSLSSNMVTPFAVPHADNPDGVFGLEEQAKAPSSDGHSSNPHVESLAGSEGELKPAKKRPKTARRPRYAFQTRSQVDVLDDGYRWRKYGQKAVKNNRFPRSYYRCTHQGCNVKKQIQRLSNEEGIVVTTYEGMHTHPIEKSNDNFEHILRQMQIYSNF